MNHSKRLSWLALTWGSLLVVALVSTIPPSSASAQQPPGAVLDFTGPGSRQARGAVVSGAEGVLTLVSSRDVDAAASSVGASLDDHAGLVQVAARLGLTLVIRGRVTGRGRRAMTQVHVLDSAGNDIAFREIAGDPRRASGRASISQGTHEALMQALTDLAARNQREQEAQARAAQAEMSELRDPGEEVQHEDLGAHMPRFAVRIGWGGRNRNATVRIDPGTDKLYQASLFSELRLAFETRPFVAESSAVMRGLYASMDMHFSLGLSSQDAVTGADIHSQAFGLLVQAGYLASLLDGEQLMLGGVIGFGYESFSLDTNTTLPSSAYPHLRLGVLGRLQIVDELLTLRADLGLRWAFGVGDFAGAFGKSSSALGYDVGLAVGGSLDFGLNWAVRFGYTRFGLHFSGATDATGPMGGVIPVEAAGGSDSGVELGLEAGWRFD